MNNIEVTNDTYNLEEYCKNEEIKIDDFTSHGILLVPHINNGNYLFAQETINFAKFCNEKTNDDIVSVLANGDIVIRDLHSFDIYLPIIQIVSDLVIQIAVNLISSYIYDKLKGRNEAANVDFTMYIKTNKTKKKLHYKGDAKTFAEYIKIIDINKL